MSARIAAANPTGVKRASTVMLMAAVTLSWQALTGEAVAQARQATGVGGSLAAMTDAPDQLRSALAKQWNGSTGRFVKGAIGLIGLGAALSAAHSAVTGAPGLQGTVRADGSLSRLVTPMDDIGSPTTSIGTSTTTSTN